MDHLWSPWRYQYVTSASSTPSGDECLFCRIAAESEDEKNYIVFRGEKSFMF